MINLFEYLLSDEAVQLMLEASTEKFEFSAASYDELLNAAPQIKEFQEGLGILDKVTALIDAISQSQSYDGDRMFVYAQSAKYFKIPRLFNDDIQKIVATPDFASDFEAKFSNNTTTVKYIGGEGRVKPTVFVTGSGSVGRVATADQEQGTCLVWNAYVKEMRDNKMLNLEDVELIKSIVSELAVNFDKEWIASFRKQIVAITKYLETIGEEPTRYNMTRYGDGKLGKVYAKYIQKYTNVYQGQKDNFDPADTILYDAKEEGTIIGILNQLTSATNDIDSAIEAKKRFVEELFTTHLVQGISLKKVTAATGSYDEFNIAGEKSSEKVGNISSYKLGDAKKAGVNDHQIKLYCKGTFNLSSLTDGEGEAIGVEPMVDVTMRSFGDSYGIDVSMVHGKKSPSLGKCPARTWREKLGIEESDSLEEAVAKFKKVLKIKNGQEGRNPKVAQIILEIVKAAIKEGPNCFPFILIH